MTETDLLHAGQVMSGRSSVPLVYLSLSGLGNARKLRKDSCGGPTSCVGTVCRLVALSLRLAHMQIFVCGSGKKRLCFATESKNEK